MLVLAKGISPHRIHITKAINFMQLFCRRCFSGYRPKSSFGSRYQLPQRYKDANKWLHINWSRGYLSAEIQLNLFENYNIKLTIPMRNNQKEYSWQPYVFRKKRKRIETLFSQPCDQFMIIRSYAKSFDRFKVRILSKITALTTIQYINRFIFNRNINNIKISII